MANELDLTDQPVSQQNGADRTSIFNSLVHFDPTCLVCQTDKTKTDPDPLTLFLII